MVRQCLQTYWERSTNFVCSENILILTLQDRPIFRQTSSSRSCSRHGFTKKHDLARNDHGSLWIFSWCISFSNYGPDDILSFLEFSHICGHEVVLLDYVFSNWKKVQCTFNETSIGYNFLQEMPACATDDAFSPVWWAFFALRLRVRLEQFKQLYVAHVLNHLLCRRTERGCRLCFIVDRFEEHVGEGGSRSSWPIHEHESSELVSQQNVAIQLCPPRSALIARYLARDLRHGRQRVALFYHD